MSVAIEPLAPAWLQALAPPPRLRVAEWADRHRILPETSAEPGQWRTARTPYLRAIMDALTDPAVETVVVQKSAQVGGSEALNNVLAYAIAHDPAPMLLIHPTIEMAEAYSKDRLTPMIQSTPALAAVVREGRGPGAESTIKHKLFPGGYLALAGANSPASLAQRPVRLLVADDVDRFPPEVGDEGDPLELARKRTTTFLDRKVYIVSTPTVRGGRIDGWFQRTDQRRYHVACPRCGRRDWITWNDPAHVRVAFAARDPRTAALACPAPDQGGCGARLDDAARLAMLATGVWRPTATAAEPGLIGFHLWEVLSPWVLLRELVAKFLAAHAAGREQFRVFVNTVLGEAWEDQALRIDPTGLLARREDYGPEVEVPAPAVCLTAGVDTQDDRFEVLVLGWGPGDEKWVVDWRPVPGDPKRPETRAALLEALTRRYGHATGVTLPIHATCLDSGGHRTDAVYDFVLAHQHRRMFATIGRGGLSGRPLVGPPSPRKAGRDARPVPLYTVNVDDGKSAILTSLSLPIPGPGALHLPVRVESVNESFVAQLTAEQRVLRRTRAGVAYEVWVQVRERNDALDAAVLALAAYRLLRPNLAQMAAALEAHLAEGAMRPPAPAPSPAPPPGRRVAPSRYVGGG